MRSEKDKMLAGELYDASAPKIQADLAATHRWLARYNAALDMVKTYHPDLLSAEKFVVVPVALLMFAIGIAPQFLFNIFNGTVVQMTRLFT